jgi:hypothetical protein
MNHKHELKQLRALASTLPVSDENTQLLRLYLADDDEPLPPGSGGPGTLREFLGRKPISADRLSGNVSLVFSVFEGRARFYLIFTQ